MTRVAVLVALFGVASMAIAVEVGCAAAVPVVGAADPAVVGPPPAPSLYETRTTLTHTTLTHTASTTSTTSTPQRSDTGGAHGPHEHNEERP